MKAQTKDSYSDIKAIIIGLIVAAPILLGFKYAAILSHFLINP